MRACLSPAVIFAVIIALTIFAQQRIQPRSTPVAGKQLTVYEKILAGAKENAKRAAVYNPTYEKISYPGGDVPETYGVCTDVVIRSFRHAGIDLQVLIHEDMKANFKLYPRNWGLKKPDKNIDHRRVPNQMKFFERHGLALNLNTDKSSLNSWQPGDIVYWQLDSGLLHCGIISENKNQDGAPLVIHNISVCREEDVLKAWKIIGHFRYPRQASAG